MRHLGPSNLRRDDFLRLRPHATILRVKLAIVSLNTSTDVHHWSGLNYHIARSLEQAGANVHRIGPLRTHWTLAMKLRQRWFDMTGHVYHAILDPAAVAAIGEHARSQIPSDTDVVLAVTSLVAAAIGTIDVPLVSWDDATYAGMLDYYPEFSRVAAVSRRQSAVVGHAAVDSVALAIYASEWAAQSAHDAFGLPADRSAVVPFGANLDRLPDAGSVSASIAARGNGVCRLLWVGVDWTRKGGPLTVAIARALSAAGVTVELTLVGCEPDDAANLPSWVRVEGFISKRDPAGEARLATLFAQSDFFIMPSSAEAYGLVYAEAAAFGVPAVAIRTGGVPTIVVDGETGLLEEPSATPERFATRMLDLFRDRSRYAEMARAARQRAEERLNWDVAGKRVMELISSRCQTQQQKP